MPTLINMELTPEEAKTETSIDNDPPKYPWGLCLTLNDEVLKKLGMTVLPQVGSKIQIMAVAEVSGVRSYQYQEEENQSSVDLQITDMKVDAEVNPADILYAK